MIYQVSVAVLIHCGAELCALEELDLSQSDSVVELDPMTVTAWHFPTEVLDVPADVVRIERDQIANSTALRVPDLLQNEANVYFRNTAANTSGGEVSMRGFGENSGLRCLVLVNGQTMNPSDMGSIDWEQLPLDAIESVEVLRGGHNVLYGDRALSGVIKIETRPAVGTHAEVKGTVGSHGYQQASATASYGFDQWGVRIGGSWMEEDGYRDHSESWSHNCNLSGEYYFETGDTLDFFISASENYNQYSGPVEDYELFKSDPTSSSNDGDDESQEKSLIATTRFKAERSWGAWEITSGYDYSDTDWSLSDRYGVNQQNGWTLRPRFLIGEPSQQVIFGTDLLYDDLDFKQYKDKAHDLETAHAEVSEGRISPYVFAQQELVDDLTLSGGVRYEWTRFDVDYDEYIANQVDPYIYTNRGGQRPNPDYKSSPDSNPEKSYSEDVNESGLAGELSLNYRLSQEWSIWCGYDHTYRYPVFDERASYQGVTLAEHVSSDLEAERGDGIDFGCKYVGERSQFFLTFYALWMDNEIGFIEDPDSGLGLNVNVGPVNRYGADAAWSYKRENYGCSTSWAVVDTEMRSGDGKGESVPLVPAMHGTNQVWYSFVPELTLTLTHRYVGEQYQGGDFENTERKLDSYNLVDARLRYDLNDHCSFYLKATNLFDESYAESAYYGAYYPGLERSFYGGVTVTF